MYTKFPFHDEHLLIGGVEIEIFFTLAVCKKETKEVGLCMTPDAVEYLYTNTISNICISPFVNQISIYYI